MPWTGEIVDALESKGQLKKTLIVFLSDNGGKVGAGANNGLLQRGKGSVYDGGYRVPMFFHWPGTVEAGNTYRHPVSALDFFPTFAGLGDAKIPSDKTLDGLDIWNDFLQGSNPRPKDPVFMMRHHAELSNLGVRRGSWKASCIGKRWQLFNLDDDIEEVNDLSQQHPELLNLMRDQAESWARPHPQPAWFDNIKSRDHWMDSNMPHLPTMFPGK